MDTDVAGSYRPNDSFFGAPQVELDEERQDPIPHRLVQGTFGGTTTRFSFYFPSAAPYERRFLQVIYGIPGGTSAAAPNQVWGGLIQAASCGAYLVESNQGAVGTADLRPADATVHAYRASAETARLSKHFAHAVYGEAPEYGYLFGAGAAGSQCIWCLENVTGVWDGAVPFALSNRDAFTAFAALNNARRLLGTQLGTVVDAIEPGGSGNPFASLTGDQREALAVLYRLGFPRGGEHGIGGHNSSSALWTMEADNVVNSDEAFFAEFWSTAGYAGAEGVGGLAQSLIDLKTTVQRVVTAGEIAAATDVGESGHVTRLLAGWMPPDMPIGVVVGAELPSSPVGAAIRVRGENAADTDHYCMGAVGDVLMAGVLGRDFSGFAGVRPGDEVHVDNRAYLAYCYYHYHHAADDMPEFSTLHVDGVPIYPQQPLPSPALFGIEETGVFDGKMIMVQNACDGTAWPGAAVRYDAQVGERGDPERFRLWWVDHADHVPASFLAPGDPPVASTRLVDFEGIILQSLHDLIAWVEHDEKPSKSTTFEYTRDCRLVLGSTPDRGGIQPVVSVTANGSSRAEVASGDHVRLEVVAEVPAEVGSIVSVEWDFDGSGEWPHRHTDVDGTKSAVAFVVDHAYTSPGTWFATARVVSQREGDVEVGDRRVVNLGRARIVVT